MFRSITWNHTLTLRNLPNPASGTYTSTHRNWLMSCNMWSDQALSIDFSSIHCGIPSGLIISPEWNLNLTDLMIQQDLNKKIMYIYNGNNNFKNTRHELNIAHTLILQTVHWVTYKWFPGFNTSLPWALDAWQQAFRSHGFVQMLNIHHHGVNPNGTVSIQMISE